MLKNISWENYIVGVILILVVYYLIVGAKFYSTEIRQFLSGKRKWMLKPGRQAAGDAEAEGPQEERLTKGFAQTDEKEFEEIERLIEQLKEVVEGASRKSLISEEFKYQLSVLLKKYPSVRDSPVRTSVIDFIVSECQKYGTVALSGDEIEQLWVR